MQQAHNDLQTRPGEFAITRWTILGVMIGLLILIAIIAEVASKIPG